MGTSVTGGIKVEKLGLGEQTRDGFTYEMDLVLEISNKNNLANSTKDRTKLFKDKPEFLITEETGELLKEWSSVGEDLITVVLREIRETENLESLKRIHEKYKNELSNNEDYKIAIETKKEKLNK